ncbi:MAG: 50S ribosomal protein L22 [Bacteroidetes bacterium]|jgi:large subunit ribosomal protein L22|nr:50S ribosomal protein L22 [Bacteroidota bacterium]MBP7256250.1 50S ribosomal protein L22 [Chitinophagales bacterium]MBK7139289.1 50S ribosomal protein L22 [Bacteroidota bacterium]MBK7503855.1 50S ribosomal protein L22 [Bacteroidota bacterium]MBK7640616.1 50S ribosomal protein L22 [Bacteroidota bacterium]
MQASAKLNNCPTSPRKMRLVVDNIRGVDVDKALNILAFTRKESALKLEKLLKSAIANWAAKFELNPEDSELYVKEVFVNGGRTLKRFLPAPQGRAYRLRKRSNHITITVASRTLVEEDNVVDINK